MSETLLKVFLADLGTVRIVCHGKRPGGQPCGFIYETDVDNLSHQPDTCPSCNEPYHFTDKDGKSVNPFLLLAETLGRLQSLHPHFDVQFVLPARPPAKP